MGPTTSRFKPEAALWPERAQPCAGGGGERRSTHLWSGGPGRGLGSLSVFHADPGAGVLGSGSILSVATGSCC